MDKPFVLIIEDERDTAALFRFVIEMAGYRGEIISHGQVAMERLATCQPEIVVLDLNLPGVPGKEILERIRRDGRLRHTRVIVITAHSHIADTLSEEQPDLILYKPLNIDELSTIVRRFTMNERLQKTIPIRGEPWDKITGMYNKSFFVNRLNSLLMQSRETKSQFTILCLNLDPKNKIENLFSKPHWESILHRTAQSLKSAIRPTDTIARFYQNEFYCMIENTPSEETPIKIAARIHKKLSATFTDTVNKSLLSIRIGILVCDDGYANIQEILRDAESAQRVANEQEEEFYTYFDRTTIKNK